MTDQFQIIISSPGRLTSNLTHPVSYGIDGKNVVIYISVFTLYKDTALSIGLCEASDRAGRCTGNKSI